MKLQRALRNCEYHHYGLWRPRVVFTIHNAEFGLDRIGLPPTTASASPLSPPPTRARRVPHCLMAVSSP